MPKINIGLTIFLIIIIAAIGVFAFLKFSNEDAWLCLNGEWIKHGNPSAPQPTTPCPGANLNQVAENTNTNVNTAPENANLNTEPSAQANIIVDSPKPNDLISSPLTIEGKARGGWYFEAVFPIKLLDEKGNQIAQTQAQAQGEWTTPDFVPFKATLEFFVDHDQNGTLVLMNDNPSGLPENQQKFEVPVMLKGAQTMTVKIFLGNENKNPNAMDCSLVYPIERKIAKTTATAHAALEELLKGPTDEEKAQTYFTLINPGVKIQRLVIENGIAKADFDEQLEFQVGGSCRVIAIRSQIVQTLKQFSTIKDVIISINGRTEDILQP